MRGYLLLINTFIFVFYNEVTHGLPFHSRSRGIRNPLFRDSCSYTCKDLASLLALSRTLDEEEEEPVKEVAGSSTLYNAEDLIMKLVNALIYATTHRIENHCHFAHSVPSASDNSRQNGGVVRSGNSGNAHSNDGLLNLDLLNSNKRDNLLNLDLSNQHLIGVSLGGRNQDGSSYASSSAYSTYSNDPVISTSRTSTASNSDGLVNVALLDPKNSNNVAAVSLGRQNVVGAGVLEKDNGNERQSESLVNLHVLNANKDNNVAELAVARQNVLGVGVGNSNNGLLNNITN